MLCDLRMIFFDMTKERYIEDITRWHKDTNFIFEWQNNILQTSAVNE